MKLAVAISGAHALPSAFVVWRGFEDSIRKAAEHGYHGVELALKSAKEVNPHDLSRWLIENGMEVSGISTGQVFAASGLYFTHPDRAIRQKAMAVFRELVDLAADFGRRVNIGRVRGFIAERQSRQEAESLFLDAISTIGRQAASCGVKLLLEPVNRYETNFINQLDEGADLILKSGVNPLGLMPDVFHMNIEDDRIGKSLERNASCIDYIHLADSNRLAPGQGHLNFDEVFDSLQAIGFDGWASIEILPRPDPDTAARQAAKFLLPRIERYNAMTSGKEPSIGFS